MYPLLPSNLLEVIRTKSSDQVLYDRTFIERLQLEIDLFVSSDLAVLLPRVNPVVLGREKIGVAVRCREMFMHNLLDRFLLSNVIESHAMLNRCKGDVVVVAGNAFSKRRVVPEYEAVTIDSSLRDVNRH